VGKNVLGGETVPLIRLHVIVEGQTEESFVNELLGPALAHRMVFVDAQKITTGRRHGRSFRGGFVKYDHLARDLEQRMKEDQAEDSWSTTMVDYYRIPPEFPGYAVLSQHDAANQRAVNLEMALLNDMAGRLPGLAIVSRLIPYIQVHEFEALLFADPSAFADAFPDSPNGVAALSAVRGQYQSPEDIDDGP
jgi:hypothetical protein